MMDLNVNATTVYLLSQNYNCNLKTMRLLIKNVLLEHSDKSQ